MTDDALRDAERRWAATRSAEDEARLLLARLRAGVLPAERLELAAWLGHAAARAALGPDAPAGEQVPWTRWARAFDAAGLALLVRLAREARLARLDGLLPPHGPEWLAGWDRLAAGAIARDAAAAESVSLEAQVRAQELSVVEPLAGYLAWNDLGTAASGVHEALTSRGGDLLLKVVAERAEARGPLVAWALGAEHASPPVAATLQDEVDWLGAQLERGQLTEARLRVAAHAGSAAAAALLGLPPPPPAPPRFQGSGPPTEDVLGWLTTLHGLDPALAGCVALTWAYEASHEVRSGGDDPLDAAADQVLLLAGRLDDANARARAEALETRLRGLEAELRPTGWRRLVAPVARDLLGRAHDQVRALVPQEVRRLWVLGALAACDLVLAPGRGLSALAELWLVTPPHRRGDALHLMREHALELALATVRAVGP